MRLTVVFSAFYNSRNYSYSKEDVKPILFNLYETVVSLKMLETWKGGDFSEFESLLLIR